MIFHVLITHSHYLFNEVSIQIFCLLLMFLLLLSFKRFLNIISVVQLLSFVDSLQPYGLQHARLPCPSPPPGVYSNSCPLNWWCQPIISSSVVPFSSCLQSFPASGSFLMNQFFNFYNRNFNVNIKMIWISIFFLRVCDIFIMTLWENFKE